jgi:hypothetical protein
MLLFSEGGASALGRLPCHKVDSLRLMSRDIDFSVPSRRISSSWLCVHGVLHRTPRKQSLARSIGERVAHRVGEGCRSHNSPTKEVIKNR